MAKKGSLKKSLIASALSLTLSASMLVGTTFAWFTDSVTNAGNKIQAGTLKIGLYEVDGATETKIENTSDPIFSYERWEPGYKAATVLKVQNNGTLALKFRLDVVKTAGEGAADICDVIEVWATAPAATYDSTVGYEWTTDYTYCGTLNQMMAESDGAVHGTLTEGQCAYQGIVLKMSEEAGNEYQGVSAQFDIRLNATQYTYEEDSFDYTYDEEAKYVMGISSFAELKSALANFDEDVELGITQQINVPTTETLEGYGHTIKRGEGYSGTLFNVAAGATLTVKNAVIDGGAEWGGGVQLASYSLTADEVSYGVANKTNYGEKATGSLIATQGNASLVLEEGTVLQNNDGASAVSLATRGGGSLTIDGAEIINNVSAGGGAIWGGGNIIFNYGKINGNHATSIGGAIRMVDGYNNITFTMNGGEMNYNTSDSTGGAIWGGNRATYYFNGGEVSYNSAVVAGGAIWSGNNESYYVNGTEFIGNSAGELGGAIRFCDHASFTMTAGKFAGNTVNGTSNAFFLNNNSATLTGGTIEDDFSYSGGLGLVIGNVTLVKSVYYGLSTNHNTAYLAEEFGTVHFTTNKIAEFNFKPADGYVYQDGDEDKLVCGNEGYETYWDTTTNTFRLQAI